MKIKGLVDEDFVNYKLPSMFIIFPKCSFKCESECGIQFCQNKSILNEPDYDISIGQLLSRYMINNISKAVVLGGLEPFDSWEDVFNLVSCFREVTDDPIVIYTGYKKEEITKYVEILSGFQNIIIKFGRYQPNQEKHFDKILGVNLASDNQYAEVISYHANQTGSRQRVSKSDKTEDSSE